MLIICPECGGKLSDQAVSCPHCGYPLLEKTLVEDPGVPEEGVIDYLPCPKCGAPLKVQLVHENKPVGFWLSLLFIIVSGIGLFLSAVFETYWIGGLLILIFVIVGARGRNETNKYVVCDLCGYSTQTDEAEINKYIEKLIDRNNNEENQREDSNKPIYKEITLGSSYENRIGKIGLYVFACLLLLLLVFVIPDNRISIESQFPRYNFSSSSNVDNTYSYDELLSELNQLKEKKYFLTSVEERRMAYLEAKIAELDKAKKEDLQKEFDLFQKRYSKNFYNGGVGKNPYLSFTNSVANAIKTYNEAKDKETFKFTLQNLVTRYSSVVSELQKYNDAGFSDQLSEEQAQLIDNYDAVLYVLANFDSFANSITVQTK